MSCDKNQKKILNILLDAYERSRTFQGTNRVSQSFSLQPEKVFPVYADDADYERFAALNEDMHELEAAGLVTLESKPNGIITRVVLCLESLDDCYRILGRKSRRKMQAGLLAVLEQYAGEQADPLAAYVKVQTERIARNKNVEYYDETDADFREYSDLLLLTRSVLDNDTEVFVRDYSMRLFGDSKRVEQLRPKLQGLLFQYGNFDARETVLAECGVIATPTYVSVKGNLCLKLGGQKLDLSVLKGDISFSTATLSDITSIRVMGQRVVTVENLTSFHDYHAGTDTVIYLGGFHNAVKRRFLELLYEENPSVEYCHFGDLDAGGFYILSHLRRKTAIPFRPLHMDVETLQNYSSFTKPLTANDRKRMQLLLEMPEFTGTDGDAIRYMLDHDCKLEQEAVSQAAVSNISTGNPSRSGNARVR